MLLKQLGNLGKERIMELWTHNPYYQSFFRGITEIQWSLPCVPMDRVLFRKRTGEGVTRLMFKTTIELQGSAANERTITVDTTVQEKSITFPTYSKLVEKIIKSCWICLSGAGIRNGTTKTRLRSCTSQTCSASPKARRTSNTSLATRRPSPSKDHRYHRPHDALQ